MKQETQYCVFMRDPDVCGRFADGTGTCGDKFDGCIWGKTKDGMNDKQSKGNLVYPLHEA
jgi:hypothetical protein